MEGFFMKKVILFLMLILSSLSFAAKKLYVGTNAEFKPYEYLENGEIVGTFVFYTGEDPTYRVIENGEWHSDREPYGVIHRVASNGVTKGVTRAAFSYGLERSGYVRIDTHEDNKPMQGALKKFGFRECGVIHLERGAERIAFDCRKEWL